jgi:quinohemoprotein amine dehydrogenase
MRVANPLIPLLLAIPFLSLGQSEQGIPVTDPLVVSKCASCHPVDDHAIMQRISFERSTPEGWEEALKRMIRANRVTLTPPEARAIVKYLSAAHGLAPQESKPIMYYVERRIHDETGSIDDTLLDSCAKCHAAARELSWRRSAAEWKEFSEAHLQHYKLPVNESAVALLSKLAPLHTPEWEAWSAKHDTPSLTGRWLVTAHVQGRGQYVGEMEVQPGAADGEFTTRVTLRSLRDGATVLRTGRNVVYDGHEWRGRSKGSNPPLVPGAVPPDDLGSEAREVMWFSPDGATAEGRWYWGQYQEFGFDVKMQRASSAPALIASDTLSLKTASRGNRVRLIGDHLPTSVKSSDVSFGPGLTVKRIISSSPTEIVAEIDVAADASPGKRDISFRTSTLAGALAIYDRVDYVRVTPESSLAAFGAPGFTRGYQQFEAVGFQRGPDGKSHTADDLELGPVDVTWSMEVFYEVEGAKREIVGDVSNNGFFTPAETSPNINYDIWVIATAKNDKKMNGDPLVGKGYVVVTVPFYMFEGRRYVRDLDRWIEDGSATR